MKPGDLIWVKAGGRGRFSAGTQLALIVDIITGPPGPVRTRNGLDRPRRVDVIVRKFRANSRTWTNPVMLRPGSIVEGATPPNRSGVFEKGALQKLERADVRAMHRADALHNQTALSI